MPKRKAVQDDQKQILLPTQAKYPKKLHVGTEVYKVRFEKDFPDYGETDPEKMIIVMKDGLSPREILSTFVHECLHALEFEHGIKIKHKTVHKLEDAITKFLLDNFL